MRVFHTAYYDRARVIIREGFRDDRDGEFGETCFSMVWLSARPLYSDHVSSPNGQVIVCLDVPAELFSAYEVPERPRELAGIDEHVGVEEAAARYEEALARLDTARARAGDGADEEAEEALCDADEEFYDAQVALAWAELRWALIPAAVVNRYRPVRLYDHARRGSSRQELMERPDKDSQDAVKFLDLLAWPTPLVLQEKQNMGSGE